MPLKASRDPEAKLAIPQERRRRLVALHQSIARDLAKLKARRSCGDIGHVCTNWSQIEQLYLQRINSPNDRSLAEVLDSSRRALDEAMGPEAVR